jgi:hypothetical protein
LAEATTALNFEHISFFVVPFFCVLFLSFLHSFSCCTRFRPGADTLPSAYFESSFYFNPVQPPNLVRVIFNHRIFYSFSVNVLILPNSKIQKARIHWHHSSFKITMGLSFAHGSQKRRILAALWRLSPSHFGDNLGQVPFAKHARPFQ